MGEIRYLPVPDGLATERIDSALSRMLGLSRSAVSKLLEDEKVRVNGTAVSKSHRLNLGEMIEVDLAPPTLSPAPVVGMEIIYEDEDLVVVNKPVGVAAHGGPGWDGPTVLANLEAAGFRISTSGPPERKGIVHRLDVGTSGAMAVAKSELAYTKLKHAFKERKVHKIYHALVSGHPDPAKGTIDAPIARHPSKEWRMAVVAGGRPAITHYQTLEVLPGAALVEVTLETGRTHQIRVHFSTIGHPCIGDTFYGADPKQADQLELKRQWLHAVELQFTHPRTNEHTVVKAPYTDDLLRVLTKFRQWQ
ncbi:RluA family pseudouridine synthase [Gleimia sp. 6138-11-ORH1]|uniref:RluA family pseudouridine synthase n=1 Tax=Gleimia sp. 6138-11-ORH1 TaxID=2973937 RepID=UPI002168BA4B|nr:RluA family pseudouridine synthase [Gleimia sp. 6138-11-ORH1]MCS4484530.1 RluA family pseudouridine synthase [Gleimia sp. 6138-11-ORH1]